MRIVALLLAALLPRPVHAHMAFGSRAFYGGLLHPWMTLDSVLILAALCLWLSQSLKLGELRPLGALAGGLTLGAVGGVAVAQPLPVALTYTTVAVLGLLVAAKVRLPRAAGAPVAATLAAAAGYLAGVDAAVDVTQPWLFAAGILVGALVVPLAVIAPLAERRHVGVAISIRVLGSWIGAVGMMRVALALRGAGA